MTLLSRESRPVSEGQTIIRSHYLEEPPAMAGINRPATTVTQEVIVVGPGVNYDANRGVSAPAWVPSQAALSASTEPGVAFQSSQSPLEVSLPASANMPLVVSKNGRAVSCRFVGANGVAPQKTDDRTARYANLFPDTDLEWQVGNGYLKETLILRSRQSPAEFSFVLASSELAPLIFTASGFAPVSSAATAAGQSVNVSGPMLLAVPTATTDRRILIPRPVIADSSGKKKIKLRCTASQTAPGVFLYTMRIPDRFLADKSLQYPLLLDPSVINVTNTNPPTVYETGKTY